MTSTAARSFSGPALALALATLLAPAIGPLSGCVSVDPETGQTLPRGKQRYDFKEVRERAKGLSVGVTKMQALLMLGSPAQTEEATDVWVYLPERKAYVVPSRSLRLQFKDGVLEEFGYHAIVLGQEL